MYNNKSVVILNSKYQLDFFIRVQDKHKIKNIYLIIPPNLLTNISLIKNIKKHYVMRKDNKYMTFLRARSIIKQVRYIIGFLELNKYDTLWTSNDENATVQCFYNMVKFEQVSFIEDGLGSYLAGSFLSYDYGLINLLKKLKSFLYFFPYYKAFYSIGGNVKANECFSYNEGAYPRQESAKKNIVEIKLVKLSDIPLANKGSTIFIGQPLYSYGFISFSEYIKYINHIRFVLEPDSHFIYKPHPSEVDVTPFLEQGITVYENGGQRLEDFIYSSSESLKVYGFFSTALINILKLGNVEKVVSIRCIDTALYRKAYRLLENSGIKVIDIA